MYYANSTFNSLYSEVYYPDFSNASFTAGFEQFHRDLLNFCGGSLLDDRQPLAAVPFSSQGPATSNSPTSSSLPSADPTAAPGPMLPPVAASAVPARVPHSAPALSDASSARFHVATLAVLAFAAILC
jgi:hypothetical protein